MPRSGRLRNCVQGIVVDRGDLHGDKYISAAANSLKMRIAVLYRPAV
jgi:hypothetical protein